MKKTLVITALSVCLGFLSVPVFAIDDDGDEPEVMSQRDGKNKPYKEARQKMKRMSPEERKTFMQETKAKWDKLSDDEKKAFKDKVKPQAERFKEKMEKKCKEMQENDGEKIYIRMYGMEQLQGK